MRSRDSKGRFIKKIQRKQKRNQNSKEEEGIIKEDIFKTQKNILKLIV